MAQEHWTFNPDNWPGETVVYGQLVPSVRTDNFTEKFYTVAAFVDGEVRAVAMCESTNDGIFYYTLRVKGDDERDAQKAITFKAYNNETQIEYNLTLDAGVTAPTFTGETYNQPSEPLHLNFTEITGISLPDNITVAKGATIDLTPLITVSPAGAPLPSNLTWDFANSSSFISIENNILTGLTPNANLYLGLYAGNLSTSTTVSVTNPATAIAIKSDHTQITVNKGDTQALTDFLNNAYTLTPADATDQVTWEIANTEIVRDMAPTAAGYQPIAGGTTTLIAQILNADGSVRLTVNQPVTVTVVVPVEDINISRQSLECNVGDDLTSYLNSLVTVSPADATNKNVTWTVEAGDAITIGSDGKIIAAKVGTASLRASSLDNSKAVRDIRVTVHNPAKDVVFKNSTLYYTYAGEDIDVTQDIISNIQFGPAGFEDITALSIASDRPNDVLTVNNAIYGNSGLSLEATALGVGTAVVTVSFTYTDYLRGYQGAVTSAVTVSKTFEVTVSQGLAGFNIEAGDLVFGEEGTIMVSPEPAGSQFDASKLSLIVISESGLPQSWAQTITQGESIDGAVAFTIVPNVPGQVRITAFYNNALVDDSRIGAEVGMPFQLSNGWQWRTITYGYAEPGTLEEVFGGSNLIEIRSQYELLYNDSQYGYFGAIAESGVHQGECYKIKTNAASEVPYIFNEGTLNTEDNQLHLNDGWTWLPNPYFYPRALADVIKGTEGDRIVSLDKGFAEYGSNGWTGSLTTLEPGQGYLYYQDGEERNLTLPGEFSMGPVPLQAGSRQVSAVSSVWQYDASSYRDVMTVVAKAAGIEGDNNLSVGAFVGNECRGEGRFIDGHLFISVHGQSGDVVTFRLYNALTGEELLTAEAMNFTPMAGTLKQPVRLTVSGSATAIGTMGADHAVETVYSVGGLRQQSLQRGVNIVRTSGGAVRKVLTK